MSNTYLKLVLNKDSKIIDCIDFINFLKENKLINSVSIGMNTLSANNDSLFNFFIKKEELTCN